MSMPFFIFKLKYALMKSTLKMLRCIFCSVLGVTIVIKYWNQTSLQQLINKAVGYSELTLITALVLSLPIHR